MHREALKANIYSKNYNAKKREKHYFIFNLLAFLLVILALIVIGWSASKMHTPINNAQVIAISSDPVNLFFYSIRTVSRMLIAIVFSIVFSLIYGAFAAKSRRAEQILIPVLDILQSVPILGYISFTVTAFLSLFPGSMLGPECAAIFAIFTSQAWNITFSFYQSLKTVPLELNEAAYVFKMSAWQKFWRLEVPFAMPNLVWNSVVSMSGAWFFVVASEVINVGSDNIRLPGIGSYIGLALKERNIAAIVYAVIAMSFTIIIYNQLIINPFVAWADRFKTESSKSGDSPTSWILNLFNRSLIIKKLFLPIELLRHFFLYFPPFNWLKIQNCQFNDMKILKKNYADYLWYFISSIAGLYGIYLIYSFLYKTILLEEVWQVMILALYTMTRVVLLIFITSLIWVPIGIYIGLRPKLIKLVDPLIQFLAAFPANLLFPVAVITITKYNLNANIWLSPLLIMGAQWYILFNVISGTASIPNDLKEAAANLNLKGWLFLKKVILPAIAPYFITGAITASGGAWNACIVGEIVSFGDQIIMIKGLGSYIALMTTKADFPRIVLGIGIMSLFVVIFNHFFWQPLYNYTTKKYQIS